MHWLPMDTLWIIIERIQGHMVLRNETTGIIACVHTRLVSIQRGFYSGRVCESVTPNKSADISNSAPDLIGLRINKFSEIYPILWRFFDYLTRNNNFLLDNNQDFQELPSRKKSYKTNANRQTKELKIDR